MKILLLTHDFQQAKDWLYTQNIDQMVIIEENSVAETNPNKFKLGFLDLNYSSAMTNAMKIMSMSYRAKRPVVLLMDMRHQLAIEQIPHDISVLFYDQSLAHRLVYHPFYKTNVIISNPQQRLELTVDNQ